jgi:2-haloacid dehalogenase
LIDAVVFDVGGVLLDWHPRHLYRQVFDDEADVERFLTEVATLPWHFQHDRGVTFAETIPALCEQFPEHAEHIRLWETRYLDMVAGEIPGTIDVLRTLRARGTRLFVLSNMPASVWPELRDAFEWFGLFDGSIISGQERIVKPDVAIYRLLVDRFGLDPATTAFVDDRIENVAAADALGFVGIQFTDADALRRVLAL